MKKSSRLLFLICFAIFSAVALKPALADARADKIHQLEAAIDQYSQEIQGKESEAQSLNNQIAIFDLQIKQIQAEIDATNLSINQLTSEINAKESDIAAQEKKIEDQDGILSQNLRKLAENDSGSLLEFLLKNDKFSDFFNDLNAASDVQKQIQDVLSEIKDLKAKLVQEKNDLEDSRAEQLQLKNIQSRQKYDLQSSKRQKQKLLEETRGQEQAYQALLGKAKEDLNKIRNQPYDLAMGFKMTFEEALKNALPAAQFTGVRAAFLMAILKIESDWGGNVGTGNWRTDMAPRDFDAFQQITSALGLNPDSTPVSRKPYYGWGGAMGPAQFLPTTWLLYADAVANLTGRRPASPWNVRDAFTACGLMLAQSGATRQTYSAEYKAAEMYIAGARWNRSLAARIYANNVMAAAAGIQKDINTLAGK